MYAESQGVSEYFTKPVKLDKLIAAAEKLMSRPPRRRREDHAAFTVMRAPASTSSLAQPYFP